MVEMIVIINNYRYFVFQYDKIRLPSAINFVSMTVMYVLYKCRTQYHRIKLGFNLILKSGVPLNPKPGEVINPDLNSKLMFKFIKINFKPCKIVNSFELNK
jgi:hypothetical protein